MATSKGELIKRMLDAFFDQGMVGASSFFRDDVIINVAGRSQISGRHVGGEGLLAFGKLRDELTDGTFHGELHDVTDSADHACALFTITATRWGKKFEYRQVNVYHFEGDQISEMFMCHFDQDVFEELYAQNYLSP